MLDLESRVDLEEPEPPVRVEEEFGRRRVVQVRGACGPDRQVVQRRAFFGRQSGRRRFLDQLLVPALDRAVSLAQRHDRSARVAQQLDLDVTRRPDLAFQVDGTVAEGRPRLRRSRCQGGRQFDRGRDTTHATTTTTGRCLDEQRKPDGLRGREDRLHAIGPIDRDRVERPRHDRDAGRLRRPAGRQLVTQCLDRIGSRSDEDQPGVDRGARERRLLRQEPVAGMDRLGPGLQRGRDDRSTAEVTLPAGAGPRRTAASAIRT